MIFAGILAGGSGKRMESKIPKQFLKIKKIPIIIRTINTFLNTKAFDKLIVAINPEWKEYFLNMIKEYNIITSDIIIIDGGTSRFDSLINITKKAYEIGGSNENNIIVSHDCARPFVSENIIKNTIEAMKVNEAVTVSISAIDTMLWSEDGINSNKVLDRTKIFNDQGPQACRINKFISLIENMSVEDKAKYMEVGKLYLDNNLKVGIVEGDRKNFKITTDIDIEYAEFLVSRGYIK